MAKLSGKCEIILFKELHCIVECDKASQRVILLSSIVTAGIVSWLVSPIHHGLVLITWVIVGSGLLYPLFRKIYHLAVRNGVERVLFCLAVFALMVLPMCHLSNEQNGGNENRRLATFPELTIKAFYDGTLTGNLENFFNDRFFGRQTLLSLHKNFSLVLGNGKESRLENNRAVEGDNNWIFYKGDKSIELYQNKLLYSDAQCEDIKGILEAQKRWFNAQNISYFYIIPPNKEDIYGEYLTGIRKIKVRESDRIGLLIDYLNKNNGECVPIYPLKALQYAKNSTNDLLYYKTDTHWSERGAYIGYLELMQQIKSQYPDLNILTEDAMSFNKHNKMDNGDLAKMLGMDFTEQMKDVSYVVPEPVNGWHYQIVEEKKSKDGRSVFIRTVNNDKTLKVMVFRDSFTIALQPYLSETFHEVLFYWDHDIYKNREVIVKEKPDIVIAETVSRHADNVLLRAGFQEVGD